MIHRFEQCRGGIILIRPQTSSFFYGCEWLWGKGVESELVEIGVEF